MDLPSPQVFRPARLSRRGEATAWALAALSGLTLLVLRVREAQIPLGALGIAVFLGLAAASISLGNWVDRKTELRLEESGVHFRNGLRDVRLAWDEIRRIEVQPSQLGDRIRVVGAESHFYFRKVKDFRYQGRLAGRSGFERGEEVLEIMVAKAGLIPTEPGSGEYVPPG